MKQLHCWDLQITSSRQLPHLLWVRVVGSRLGQLFKKGALGELLWLCGAPCLTMGCLHAARPNSRKKPRYYITKPGMHYQRKDANVLAV
jgi:hypothetical protein